jgi:regulator of sigma E protease
MLFTALVFIVILSLLVFVHEVGHFFTARFFKVKTEEFGFGLPPRICGWKKLNGKRKFFWGSAPAEEIKSEGTILSLNWLPLGGFVTIKGQDGESSDADSFAAQKAWKRFLILAAGVFMNLVLAAVLISGSYMIGAPQVIDDANAATARDVQIQIIQVLPESPAAAAGLAPGDTLLALDGKSFTGVAAVQSYINEKAAQTVKFQIKREGVTLEKEIIPAKKGEIGQVGVALVKSGIVSFPWYEALWLGITTTFFLLIQIILGFYNLLKNVFIGQPAGVEVSGPIGIAVLTGQVARLGFVYILQFASMLSINLAIINFLPFPALDGGRVLFIIIEKIRGKKVNQKVEQIVHAVGLALLLLLFVVITGRDLLKLF